MYPCGYLKYDLTLTGIQEHASIDMAGVKGLWPLRFEGSETDNVLVLSFVGETRLLRLAGEEVEETEISGFKCDERTLYCSNVNNNQILQVDSGTKTEYECRKMVSRWYLCFFELVSAHLKAV